MDKEKVLREELLKLLSGGNAHMSFQEAVANFPMSHINDKFPNGTYSAWGLIEHIRITQWDILDFMVNSGYKELDWPADYWPSEDKIATKEDWVTTIKSYERDLHALKKIVQDPKTDLSAKIPWGGGQNIFREIVLVADHTSYHLGELGIMRQVMNTWGKNH